MATKPKSTATTAEKPVANKAVAAKPVAAKKAAPKTVLVKPVVEVAAPAPAAVPAKKAAAPRKTAIKTITPVDTVLSTATVPQPFMTPEERNHYISVAAFYIAERRGFTPGNPAEDWVAAETEVDRLMATGYFAA